MTDHGFGLAPGDRISEFRIEKELGAGGFGVTYLAWDEGLERWVALKEYLPKEWGTRRHDGSVGPSFSTEAHYFDWGLEKFLEEARTLARLNHPQIVRVHRVVEARGTAYMAMEYVEGRSLSSELRSVGRLGETRVRQILDALMSGLEAVHARGILHRDIKPANVMLRADDGMPVLIDFGAARQNMSRESRSLMSALTPPYAPVEQYETDGDQGPWTDIYALGVLTYECLSGERPAESVSRFRNDTTRPLVEVTPTVSPQLATLVEAALEVDERDRPQDVASWRGTLVEDIPPSLPPSPESTWSEPDVTGPPERHSSPSLPGDVFRPARDSSPSLPGEEMRPAGDSSPSLGGRESQPGRDSSGYGQPSGDPVEGVPGLRATGGQRKPRWAALSVGVGVAAVAAGGLWFAIGGDSPGVVADPPPDITATATPESDPGGNDPIDDPGTTLVVTTTVTTGDNPTGAGPDVGNESRNGGGPSSVPAVTGSGSPLDESQEDAVSGNVSTSAPQEADPPPEPSPDPSPPGEEGSSPPGANPSPSETVSPPPAEAVNPPEEEEGPPSEEVNPPPETESRQPLETESPPQEEGVDSPEEVNPSPVEEDDPGPGLPLPGTTFDDCMPGEACAYPLMVVIPPSGGSGTVQTDPLAVSVHEVTVEQWRACAQDANSCDPRVLDREGNVHPDGTGFPVVAVTWEDAQAYVAWLSGRTGQPYRLLTEAEWEHMARAGTQTGRYWSSESELCGFANAWDVTAHNSIDNSSRTFADCDDGYANTAPVGSFGANAFGVHDALGNVEEWVENRVVRGGSWRDGPGLLGAERRSELRLLRAAYVGFRVVRTIN